ncbi:MAG TPA: LytTR family DNA-binding domain-containing protein [Bryobacteraceae bacterium]|nr:LytTR family DNA-binding domain-containing protein [Bryobacteraceae bacterium]
MMRTLVIDDEPLAREKIARHLASHRDVEVIGECGDGESAIQAIRDLEPDLLFLDIHLPECDAFEVLRRAGVKRHPVVIFVTAYDEYALRAFEVQALDYLVKPFDDERFRSALQRGREQLAQARAPVPATSGDGIWNRVLVHTGGSIRILKHGDIDWVESAGNYVRLHVGAETYLHRDTMHHVESSLDPARFIRIHRCYIVNLDRIRELQPLFKGTYNVILQDGTQLTLTPPYRARLQL